MGSGNDFGSDLDVDRYQHFYREMVRIRFFEEAAIRSLDEGLIFGAVHPSIGQEAIAVGVCCNLGSDDIILSTHRGHGHTMAKGANPLAMMQELFGRKGGVCMGKGGSMHIADFGVGMLGANGVVGANINIAVGAAQGIKLQRKDHIVVCFFGDGAINRGPFLEGLNWAALFELPVLFVCEDNGFSASTRTSTTTAGLGAAARARAIGLEATEIDGNDIVAVDEAVSSLVQCAHDNRPQVLVAHTYRLTGHTAVDKALYRSRAEVEARWGDDPVTRCRILLEQAGVPHDELEMIVQEAEEEMSAAYEEARTSEWPPREYAYTDVQDIGAPTSGGH